MIMKLTSQRFQEICRWFFESSWNKVEQFEAKTGAFYFTFQKEVKNHLENNDLGNAWKVSWFFAFFYDAFVVHLQYCV